MKLRIGFFILLISFSLIQCRTIQKYHLYILSISLDSKNILMFNRGAGEDTLIVYNIPKKKEIYQRPVKNHLVDALFVNTEKVLVFLQDSTASLYDIRSDSSQEINFLKGIIPKGTTYSQELGSIFFGNVTSSELYSNSPKSVIYSFNIEENSMKKFHSVYDLSFLFSIAVINSDTLLLNNGGTLEIYDLKSEKFSWVKDKTGKRIFIGESPVNLNKNKTKVLFSYKDNGIAFYSLKSKEIHEIDTLKGYIYPILSPDNTFIIALNAKSPTYEAVLIKDVSFLN